VRDTYVEEMIHGEGLSLLPVLVHISENVLSDALP
jgi:hypothetical protein